MMEKVYGGLKPGAGTKATRGRAATRPPVNRTRRWGCTGVLLLYVLAALGLGLLLTGCTTTRTVPVEMVRTEYVGADTTALMQLVSYLREQVRSKERTIDSLMQSYSERLVLNDNGDTLRHDRERIVYRSSYREKELERELTRRDSVIKDLRTQLESVKSDSIPVPYPVEKKLTQWQQTKMDFGGFALGGVAVALCIAVVWLIRKFRR